MPLPDPAGERRDPLVSVVIPAYNCEAYIRDAVDSVVSQTFTDYELIVVNDASTDGTPQILRSYERSGRLRVVAHERNRGLSAARNSGIRAARGKYVTFLDADDAWRPEKLEYQMAILRERPDIMLLGNEEMTWIHGRKVTFPPLPERPQLRPVEWRQLLSGRCSLSPSNAIMRKECFEAVGGFDETLRSAEDRDQWLRIVRRFPAMVDPAAVVNAYRVHPSNMSANPTRMRDNMKAVLRKAFNDVPCPWPVRARAYAHCYLDVAINCYECRKRLLGLDQILKSLLVWPFPLGGEAKRPPLIRLVWAAKIALGRSAFERVWMRGRSA